MSPTCYAEFGLVPLHKYLIDTNEHFAQMTAPEMGRVSTFDSTGNSVVLLEWGWYVVNFLVRAKLFTILLGCSLSLTVDLWIKLALIIFLPFSSDIRPRTEVKLSKSCLNFITRSARTNQFFLRGFTISSLSTRWTSVYSSISLVQGGLYS